MVENRLQSVAAARLIQATVTNVRSFFPGRPQPTHRYQRWCRRCRGGRGTSPPSPARLPATLFGLFYWVFAGNERIGLLGTGRWHCRCTSFACHCAASTCAFLEVQIGQGYPEDRPAGRRAEVEDPVLMVVQRPPDCACHVRLARGTRRLAGPRSRITLNTDATAFRGLSVCGIASTQTTPWAKRSAARFVPEASPAPRPQPT